MPVGQEALGHAAHGVSINLEAAKAAPAAAYLGATVFGMPMSDVVTMATGVYVVLQIILLIPRYVEMFGAWRKRCRSETDSLPPGPAA